MVLRTPRDHRSAGDCDRVARWLGLACPALGGAVLGGEGLRELGRVASLLELTPGKLEAEEIDGRYAVSLLGAPPPGAGAAAVAPAAGTAALGAAAPAAAGPVAAGPAAHAAPAAAPAAAATAPLARAEVRVATSGAPLEDLLFVFAGALRRFISVGSVPNEHGKLTIITLIHGTSVNALDTRISPIRWPILHRIFAPESPSRYRRRSSRFKRNKVVALSGSTATS
jgi:nucleoid-associated protein YgaU